MSELLSVPLPTESRDGPLRPAAAAFDAIAPTFDARFGDWLSVASQRRAVRRTLLRAFPPGSSVLEIGGGTGEDAAWLARRGRWVLMTDASPGMVEVARGKLANLPLVSTAILAAEDLPLLARDRRLQATAPFDGCFSNFAALNCVDDLHSLARSLASLVRPGGQLVLVLFGPLPPGEVLVQLLRGTPRSGFRRLGRGGVCARLGENTFHVRYHRPWTVRRAFAPWFRPVERRGIGIFVPPSAAEPWISARPGLLRGLERLDRTVERPLALLGDHLLYRFARSGASTEERRSTTALAGGGR